MKKQNEPSSGKRQTAAGDAGDAQDPALDDSLPSGEDSALAIDDAALDDGVALELEAPRPDQPRRGAGATAAPSAVALPGEPRRGRSDTRWMTFRDLKDLDTWERLEVRTSQRLMLDDALETATDEQVRRVILAVEAWYEAQKKSGVGGSPMAKQFNSSAELRRRLDALRSVKSSPRAADALRALDASERLERAFLELREMAWGFVKNDAELDGVEHAMLLRDARARHVEPRFAEILDWCRERLQREQKADLKVEPAANLGATSSREVPPLDTQGRFPIQPRSISELHRAILDDAPSGFARTLKVLETEALSLWAERAAQTLSGDDRAVFESLRRAAQDAEQTGSKTPLAVWEIMWRTGYRLLHLGRGVRVERPAQFVSLGVAPSDLTQVLSQGLLQRWVKYALGDSELSAHLDRRIRLGRPGVEQAFLWAAADDALSLGGTTVRTLEDLQRAATSLAARYAEFLDALASGVIEDWWSGLALRHPRMQSFPARAFEAARRGRSEVAAAAVDVLGAAGLQGLVVLREDGVRVLRYQPPSHGELVAFARESPSALAEAVRSGAFDTWLERCRGESWGSRELQHWAQSASDRPTDERVAQSALYHLGVRELMLEEGLVLRVPSDLVRAYEAAPEALHYVALDGRLADWAAQVVEPRSQEVSRRIGELLAKGRLGETDLAATGFAWLCGARSIWVGLELCRSLDALRDACDAEPGDAASLVHSGLAEEFVRLQGAEDAAAQAAALRLRAAGLDDRVVASDLAELLGAPPGSLELWPATLDFRGLAPGSWGESTLTIQNRGSRGVIAVSVVPSETPELEIKPHAEDATLVIPAGGSQEVRLRATVAGNATLGIREGSIEVRTTSGTEAHVGFRLRVGATSEGMKRAPRPSRGPALGTRAILVLLALGGAWFAFGRWRSAERPIAADAGALAITHPDAGAGAAPISSELPEPIASPSPAQPPPPTLPLSEGCAPGLGECDGRESTSCETSLVDDVRNCGACGQVCRAETGWAAACEVGVCTRRCAPNHYDRDGVASNGCEYRCSPREEPDLPDAYGRDTDCDGYDGHVADSVFVSATAMPGGDGGPNKPFVTISAGLDAARRLGRHHLLVAAGFYTESITLVSGVSIHGGYDPTTWARSTRARTDVTAARPDELRTIRAVRGEKIVDTTVLERLDIHASDVPPSVPGGSAYGVWCRRCPGLVLDGLHITAGAGAPGLSGANGMPGAAGMPGGQGGAGSADADEPGAGGAGGTSQCGPRGGRGGAGGGSGDKAGTAGQTVGNAAGGVGGAQGDTGRDGAWGRDGPVGRDGTQGTPGRARVDDAGLWSAGGGTAGTAGGPGGSASGGGGGGGQHCSFLCDDGAGNGGGGGGGGGCPGTVGAGGGGGGSSFAVFLSGDSTGAHILGCELRASTGASGGNGGRGGAGGSGGPRGAGGEAARGEIGRGGSGGHGGRAGNAGNGGAGAGGASVGLFCNGHPVVLERSRTYAAAPGAGGRWPAPATDGVGMTVAGCPGIAGRPTTRGGRRPR